MSHEGAFDKWLWRSSMSAFQSYPPKPLYVIVLSNGKQLGRYEWPVLLRRVRAALRDHWHFGLARPIRVERVR